MEESGDREAVEALKGGNGYMIKIVKMTSENVFSVLWRCYYTIEKKKMLTHFEIVNVINTAQLFCINNCV